jgi:catechol 2,3-dioxygenase-like lactoylglutathione lyase family enzyme
MPEAIVNVRYMVDDVEAAVAWYTTHLGFTLLTKHAPAFAGVQPGDRCALPQRHRDGTGRIADPPCRPVWQSRGAVSAGAPGVGWVRREAP